MTGEPWSLPASWHWSTFSEVARVASDLVDPRDYPNDPHVAPNHIERETGRLLPFATIAEDGVMSAKHRFHAGQILYSKIRPYLAKVVVVDFDGLCSADMYPVETELDPRFLKWWMLTREFTRQAAGQQARTILPKINKRALGLLPVPVAPPDEQRRIVDILENHLSRLDAAGEGCAASRLKLQALRLSILSSVLFEREDWPHVVLGDALGVSVGGVWGSEAGVDEVDVRVLRVTELKPQGRLDPSTAALRSISQRQLSTRQLQPGDLLLEKSGGGPNSPVGRVGLVGVLESASICSNFMQLMRPRQDDILPRFLHLYLNAFHARGGTVPMQKASTNIRNVKSSEYLRMLVPMPGKAAQEAAVHRLEVVLGAVDRMEADINQTLTREDALRHALLNAAFSGRLTDRTSNMDRVEEMAGV